MYKIGITGGIACGKSFICNIFQAYGIQIVDADLVSREVVLPNSEVVRQIAKNFGEEVLASDGSLNRQQLREIVFADSQKLQLLNSIIHPAIHYRMMELAHFIENGQPLPQTYLNLKKIQVDTQKAKAQSLKQSAIEINETEPNIKALDLDPQYDYTQPLDFNAVISSDQKPPYLIFDIPLLFENKLEGMVDRILVIDASEQTQLARLVHRDNCSLENAKNIIARQVTREYRREHAHDLIQTDILNVQQKREKVLELHLKYCNLK